MKENLQKLYPAITPFLPFLEDAMQIADLSTKPRLALFLATLAHESGGFKKTEENLNYSAERLAVVWPARFATKASQGGKGVKTVPNKLAREIAYNPPKIADIVYGNRYGNIYDGDGWKYRGRGLIMTTFRENYSLADKAMGLAGRLLDEPNLLTQPEYAMKSAAHFWARNKINAQADNILSLNRAASSAAWTTSRRKVQGGTLGLADVQKHFNQIIKEL